LSGLRADQAEFKIFTGGIGDNDQQAESLVAGAYATANGVAANRHVMSFPLYPTPPGQACPIRGAVVVTEGRVRDKACFDALVPGSWQDGRSPTWQFL